MRPGGLSQTPRSWRKQEANHGGRREFARARSRVETDAKNHGQAPWQRQLRQREGLQEKQLDAILESCAWPGLNLKGSLGLKHVACIYPHNVLQAFKEEQGRVRRCLGCLATDSHSRVGALTLDGRDKRGRCGAAYTDFL